MTEDEQKAYAASLPRHAFDGYVMRQAVAELDADRAARWTAADPVHRGLSPTYWTTTCPGIESMVLEDERGPVLFFRVQRTKHAAQLRMFIQFAPTDEVAQLRTARALWHGFRWFQPHARSRSITDLITDSKNPSLIAFLQRRLGFTLTTRGDDLVKTIGG